MISKNNMTVNFKNAYHQAAVNIKITSNWISNIQHQQLQQYELTLPQFNILRILRGAKEVLSVKEIKLRMIEKSPNTTRLIDKLLQKELIERYRCTEDRRMVYLKISKAGLEILDLLDNDFDEIIISNSLSLAEVNQLNDLLNKCRCKS